MGQTARTTKLLLALSEREQVISKKIVDSKRDPDLVTVAVDLNVKQLAVITVCQHGRIILTRFVSDQGLDQHRYRHMKRVAKKQWQSGRPFKGEHSNQHLWWHIRHQNNDSAHKTVRAIVAICEQYPGCVLAFERLRVIKPKGGGKVVRFTYQAGQWLTGKGGKLFFCPVCHYECHTDFNASCNVHHSFFRGAPRKRQRRVRKPRLSEYLVCT